MPAKAEPLFPVPEVNAYKISDRPCGPALFSCDVPKPGARTEIPARIKMTSGKIKTYSIDILTSYDSIFLPKYSGVRPTIRPAIKTDKITKISLSLIHISEPTRLLSISYAVFCLKKKK